MKKKIGFLIASVVAIALAGSHLTGQQPAGKAPAGGPEKENTADQTAIKSAGQSFAKAYMTGDAKGLAAHWTEKGEYFADDGTTIRGRANIETAYAELFAKQKAETKAQVETTSIRFPSKDTAIEEGFFKVWKGKEPPVATKYTILHVREQGQWLMAVVRELPSEGVSLRDLDWLLGTWVAQRGDNEIRTTYEWWGDKTFIRVNITLKQKDRTVTGFQMIGKDRSTGQLRSWTFDPDGSFGEATWTRNGKKWVQEFAAVLDTGTVVSATHILTSIDDDTFTFQSVERTVGGAEAPDIPPVRVVRVKGE
jgi:uncharacterized protein (TIGR02246 family)